MIRFFVPGKPQPAGSKKGFAIKRGGQYTGRVAVVDDNDKSRDWKAQVAWTARQARGTPMEGPIELTLQFFMQRPKGHYNAKGLLKPSAPRYPTTKPDATKLLRAVEDAMTGIVWRDDAQIVIQHVSKKYAEPIGVQIDVSPLEHDEAVSWFHVKQAELAA
jgi:Holliday junction resolvase RusA-like endonuclease